jgi:hypothetical protein
MKRILLRVLVAATFAAALIFQFSCSRPPKVPRTSCPLELEQIFHSRNGGFSIEYYKGWKVTEDYTWLFMARDPETRSMMIGNLISREELKAGDLQAVKEWIADEINTYGVTLKMEITNVVKTEDMNLRDGKKGYMVEMKMKRREAPAVNDNGASATAGDSTAATASQATPSAAEATPSAAATTPQTATPQTATAAGSGATAPPDKSKEAMTRLLVIPRDKEALEFFAIWDPTNQKVQQAVDCMFSSLYLWY